MFPALAVTALLAASQPTASIPQEDVVLALRRARIAREVGDPAAEKKILDDLLAAHPEDLTCLAAALERSRRDGLDSEPTRALRARVLTVLSQPGRVVPYPLLADIAADEQASNDELSRIAEILEAQPGEAGERVERLRLRIAVLDRLERRDERLAETERLAGLDPDPVVLWNLLVEYRTAERWEDVLRTLERLQSAGPFLDGSWMRLEALAALGRLDELEKETAALIEKMPRTGPPGASGVKLEHPLEVQAFFPTIFRLVDAGRTDAAAKLATRLEQLSGGLESIERLRVMLFAPPEERTAFLEKAAASSLASADGERVRYDADRRLIEKDFATASALYKRALELDTAQLSRDPYFWFNYGLASVETQAWADADTAMTKAIALDPKMSRALAHRARARVMLERIPEGIADAEAALALDPKSKHACYAMYLAYHTLGETAKAEEWLARFKNP